MICSYCYSPKDKYAVLTVTANGGPLENCPSAVLSVALVFLQIVKQTGGDDFIVPLFQAVNIS